MSGWFDPAPLVAFLRERAACNGQSFSGYVIARGGDSMYRQSMRWQTGQKVSERAADEVAVAFGAHPGDIWPEWYDVEIPDDEHGTAISYDDGCSCLPCLRAALDRLRDRMWEMSPLTTEQLIDVHDGTEPPLLTVVPDDRDDETEAA